MSNSKKDELGPKQRVRSSSATESSKPVTLTSRRPYKPIDSPLNGKFLNILTNESVYIEISENRNVTKRHWQLRYVDISAMHLKIDKFFAQSFFVSFIA